MGKTTNNSNIAAAKKARDDEFYTPYDFIQEEVDHYAAQLEGKVIFCPCDNPRWSNFVRYFVENFDKLNLKAVLCSFYEGSEEESGTHVCWAIKRKQIVGDNCFLGSEWSYSSSEAKSVRRNMIDNGWRVDDSIDIGYAKKNWTKQCNDNGQLFLTEKGSFNSNEARQLADYADVIITNPPFSKFSLFIDFCLSTNKKFLCVGSNIAVNMKGVFAAWKNGLLHGGYGCEKSCWFDRPDGSTKEIKVNWYTNMEVLSNVSEFKTGKTMADIEPKYYDERKDVMYLPKCADYPDDYFGLCAVPVNAFYRFNPAYFEIVDGIAHGKVQSHNGIIYGTVEGKDPSFRILIKRIKQNAKLTVDNIVERMTLSEVAPAQSNGRGYLYIIADEHGRIKIGITTNPAQDRLRQLQTGNADDLTLVAVSNPVFNYEDIERRAHERFKGYNVKNEWFSDACLKHAICFITKETAPSKNDVRSFRNIQ